MSTLERAIEIAASAHAGQVDKGDQPYILHPLRVMMAVRMTEERIVAVLHDVIEDTEWTLDRLHAEGFSESVLNGLDAVTRRPGENYDDFVRRASRDVIGLNVKLEDLRDNANLSRISRPTDVDRKRIEKYQRAITWLTLTRNEAGRLVEQRS